MMIKNENYLCEILLDSLLIIFSSQNFKLYFFVRLLYFHLQFQAFSAILVC